MEMNSYIKGKGGDEMALGDGGHRYCPYCKKVVETRVIAGQYTQVDFKGITAKKRQIVCGTDNQGSHGFGNKWFTLEMSEDFLNSL
jgi:hypothetical protein